MCSDKVWQLQNEYGVRDDERVWTTHMIIRFLDKCEWFMNGGFGRFILGIGVMVAYP